MPTQEDMRAYDERRTDLEQQYSGKFVVFHAGQLVGAFDDSTPQIRQRFEILEMAQF